MWFQKSVRLGLLLLRLCIWLFCLEITKQHRLEHSNWALEKHNHPIEWYNLLIIIFNKQLYLFRKHLQFLAWFQGIESKGPLHCHSLNHRNPEHRTTRPFGKRVRSNETTICVVRRTVTRSEIKNWVKSFEIGINFRGNNKLANRELQLEIWHLRIAFEVILNRFPNSKITNLLDYDKTNFNILSF